MFYFFAGLMVVAGVMVVALRNPVASALSLVVSFIGLERPGHAIDPSRLPPYIREKLRIARMPQLDISSTDIRKRRTEGRSIRYLVPDEVYHYIVRNDLYGA